MIVSVRVTFAQTEITTCGQEIEDSAYLTADLSCPGLVGTEGYGNAAVVLLEGGTLDFRGFAISDSDTGVYCVERCKLINATIRDTRLGGVIGENLVVQNMTFLDAGFEGDSVATIYDYHLKVIDSTISGAGRFGVLSNHAALVRSTVTGSGALGVWSHTVRLRDSSATGNGTSPECHSAYPCADLGALNRRPRLQNSTCERSLRGSDSNWGVCTLD